MDAADVGLLAAGAVAGVAAGVVIGRRVPWFRGRRRGGWWLIVAAGRVHPGRPGRGPRHRPDHTAAAEDTEGP